MRFLFAGPALIPLSYATALPADPVPVTPAPQQPLMVPMHAGRVPMTLPAGLDLTSVHTPRVVIRWTADSHGYVQDIRFPPTGSPRVDAAVHDSIQTGQSGPTAYAHVFLLPVTAASSPAINPGPMIPMTPVAIPNSPAAPAPPVTERPIPVFVGPSSAIGDISGVDFSSISYTDISGKTYIVGWTVGEDGTVTDVSISPAPKQAVGDLFIDYFLSMRFLPSVHNGKPQLTRMSHTFTFGP